MGSRRLTIQMQYSFCTSASSSLSELCEKVVWPRGLTESWGTFRQGPHNGHVQQAQWARSKMCTEQAGTAFAVCWNRSMCFVLWHSPLSGGCTEMRIQVLLPKYQEGNKSWGKLYGPLWSCGSMAQVICETSCCFGLDVSENWWVSVAAMHW